MAKGQAEAKKIAAERAAAVQGGGKGYRNFYVQMVTCEEDDDPNDEFLTLEQVEKYYPNAAPRARTLGDLKKLKDTAKIVAEKLVNSDPLNAICLMVSDQQHRALLPCQFGQ